jgi:hypothetical protein
MYNPTEDWSLEEFLLAIAKIRSQPTGFTYEENIESRLRLWVVGELDKSGAALSHDDISKLIPYCMGLVTCAIKVGSIMEQGRYKTILHVNTGAANEKV